MSSTMSSIMSGMGSLHCELLDLIFDELELLCEDDQAIKETFGACRLVCTWLNDFASPILFRTLELTRYSFHSPRVLACGFTYGTPVGYREGGEESSQHLLSLFDANPKIAPLVRSFHIGTYVSKKGTQHWMFESKTLPRILEMITNVKHLSFRGHCGRLVWSSIGKALIGSLEDLFRRPSVCQLAFKDIGAFPLGYILTCSNIRHLSITDDTHEYRGLWSAPLVDATRRHHSLEVSPRALQHNGNIWRDEEIFRKSEYLSNISVLKLKLDYIHPARAYDAVNWDEQWGSLLRNVPRLRELEIGVSSEGQWAQASTWPSADSISSLRCLQVIRVTVSIAYTNKYTCYIPQIITTVFKSSRPMQNVKVIHITVLVFFDDTMERITQGWREHLKLDEWLQHTYPMLTTMILEFCSGASLDGDDEDWKAMETDRFSRVAMREMAEKVWPVLVTSSSIVVKIITPTDAFEL